MIQANIEDEVISAYNRFKLGQGERLRGFIYKVAQGTVIVIDQKFPLATASWEDMVNSLPEDEARYLLVDFDAMTADGRPVSRLIFVTWTPDSASVKQKMLYSGCKESLKTVLDGVGLHLKVEEKSELNRQTIMDWLLNKQVL